MLYFACIIKELQLWFHCTTLCSITNINALESFFHFWLLQVHISLLVGLKVGSVMFSVFNFKWWHVRLNLISHSVNWGHHVYETVLLSVKRCTTVRLFACLIGRYLSSSFAPHPLRVEHTVHPPMPPVWACICKLRPASRRLRADRNDLEVQESHVTSPGMM